MQLSDRMDQGNLLLSIISAITVVAAVVSVYLAVEDRNDGSKRPPRSNLLKENEETIVFGIRRIWWIVPVEVGRGGWALLGFLIFGGLILFADRPLAQWIGVSLSQLLGPASLIGLFNRGLCRYCGAGDPMGRRSRLPIFSFVITVFVVLSGFDWNEQHWVRERPLDLELQKATAERLYGEAGAGRDAFAPLDAGPAFGKWADTRGLKPDDRVFIVAAQGGGLYAAYHAAYALAAIRDENPEFARRLFAVSGVSGGAVGGAGYAAIADTCREPEGYECPDYKFIVDQVMTADYLSPLVSRMLFVDLGADLLPNIPFGGLRSWADRTKGPEDVFSEALSAWARPIKRKGDFLERHLLQSWAPEDEDGPPALLLNTTEVSTGRRLVLSPFRTLKPEDALPREDGPTTYVEGACMAAREANRDAAQADCDGAKRYVAGEAMAVKSAAFLSARFPVATPPGRIQFGVDGAEGVHVIDGGSFDNTGVETAHDLIRAIHAVRPEQKIGLLILSFAPDEQPTPFRDGHHFMGELLSPAAAFFASWRARGLRSRDIALRGVSACAFGADPEKECKEIAELCKAASDSSQCAEDEAASKDRLVSLHRNRLQEDEDRAYTLTWLLSGPTYERIRSDIGIGVQFCDKAGSVVCERNTRAFVSMIAAY